MGGTNFAKGKQAREICLFSLAFQKRRTTCVELEIGEDGETEKKRQNIRKTNFFMTLL